MARDIVHEMSVGDLLTTDLERAVAPDPNTKYQSLDTKLSQTWHLIPDL